ncbi:reverse transcriptase domain-containing protein, partial [Tanacetum coccineum]
VENMDTYRDQDMGEVIVRKPFCRVSCVEARWFDGLITIHNGNNNVTYQMAHSHPRKRRKQIRNEDLHIELDYYSEEYDEEREMEPRHALVRETTLVFRTGSPSAQRQRGRVVEFEDAPNRDGSKVESLQPFNGHMPTYVNPYFLPNAGMTYDQPSSYSFHAQGGNVFSERASACHPYGGYTLHAPMSNYGLFADSTGCVTPFVCWIKDYPLPDGLKIPSHPAICSPILSKTSHGYGGTVKKQTFLPLIRVCWRRLILGLKQKKSLPMEYQMITEKVSTDLIKSPREILATEKEAKTFEQPPSMVRSRRSRDMSKYCHFHEDHGHDTNQCRELRHQIEETIKSGKLAHLVKGIKKGKTKALGDHLPLISSYDNSSDPVIIWVRISERQVNRAYKDSGSSYEVIYEHCFLKLKPSIRALRVDSKIPLIGFLGEQSGPLEEVPLEVTIGESPYTRKETLNFVIVSSDSHHDLLLGRTAMKKMSIVVSRVHATIKFHTPYIIGTMSSTYESNKVEEGQKRYAEKTIIIKKLPTSFKKRLQDLLRSNANVFTWTYADITGIPRTITVGGKPVNTEHKLNEYNHIKPIKPKKHGLCLDRKEAACKEVNKLTNVGALRKAKDQTWVANLVMVYHQTQMDKGDEDKTSFFIRKGVFCYWKMPFGLKNARATYQRLVDKKAHSKGNLITKQGIKANPSKVMAVTVLEPPRTLKDVHSLNGKLASLSRFLLKSAEKSLPFFKALKSCTNKKTIRWTVDTEKDFLKMKEFMEILPTLTAPMKGEVLVMYLAALIEYISDVLLAKKEKRQVPIYFVSRVLPRAEPNYLELEKLILALVHITRRLQRYFQAHLIQVLTNKPIKQILARPEKSGRIAKWAIKLEEHDIEFKGRDSVKGRISS